MAEYFVRLASSFSGRTSPQIWTDIGNPMESVESKGKIKTCVALTQDVKQKYEQYLEQRTSEGVGFSRSSKEHFPLSFFEWLQVEYPEKGNEDAELPGKET